jgi:hypothetical protein
MLHDVVENTPLLSIRLASVAPAHRVGVSRVLRRQLAQRHRQVKRALS